MRYLITTPKLSFANGLTISMDDYENLKNSRNVLTNAFSIEEKYEIIIQNYTEFEQTLFHETTNYILFISSYSYEDFYYSRTHLNKNLANLLTSIRMYQDQVVNNVKNCSQDKQNIQESVNALFSQEFDARLEYQFMEKLRNFVQHQGLPIHYVSIKSHWTSFDDDGMLEYSYDLRSNKEVLEEGKAIKEDLARKLDDRVDLKKFTRVYVESISKIHESIRLLIEENVNTSRDYIENIHKRFTDATNLTTIGLSAFIINEDKVVEEIPLLLDWDNIRVKIKQKNKQLIKLDKCYATGAINKK